MKHIARYFVLMLILGSINYTYAQTKWIPYSSDISFKIKNAGFTVTGRLEGLKANLIFSTDKLDASSLKATVEVNSIKTGINKRDVDLKKEEYFDADKFRQIEITSTKLYKQSNKYAGTFILTIKGVSKQLEIPFDFKQTGNDVMFDGSFTINRRDYNVGGKSLMMSDNLIVHIAIKARAS